MGVPIPTWLEPLPLDPALVDAAVAACRDAADVLRSVTEEREGCFRYAAAEWRGPHRAGFEAAALAATAEASALAAALRHLAGSLEANRVEVERQNLERAAGRQRWLAEQGGG